MKSYLVVVVIAMVMESVNAQGKRVPTTAEIEDYDDPVLKEIFKKKVPPSPELQATNYGQQPTYQGGEVPPQPQGSYSPQQPQQYRQPPPSLSSSYNPGQGSTFVSPYVNSGLGQAATGLAYQGAQGFYSGAQTVSNAFGLQQYEAPFISSAASFFG